MSFLSVEKISAGYGGHPILADVSFQLEQGCMMGILGANGCGKTTLLKTICGILPHKGTCLLEQTVLEQLSARRMARLVGYIPQRSGISIDISVLDVVMMGFNPRLGLLERPGRKMQDLAAQALEQVGLGGREQSNYLCLSEGQKQLCILARTLVSGSRLLLLDEPVSGIDQNGMELFYKTMDYLKTHYDLAIILISHDLDYVAKYADHVVLLDKTVAKQGTVKEVFESKEFERIFYTGEESWVREEEHK